MQFKEVLVSSLCASAVTASAIVARDDKLVTGFEYVGCHTESVHVRDPKNEKFTAKRMTLEMCGGFCNRIGGPSFQHFGVQKDECFCGENLTNGSTAVDWGKCDQRCTGDGSERCGAEDRLSIYKRLKNADDLDKSPDSRFTTLGCWEDQVKINRDDIVVPLSAARFSMANMTTDICAKGCKNYSHFGIEHGTDCHCGIHIAARSHNVNENNCTTPCPGKTSEVCGGSSFINIYEFSPNGMGAVLAAGGFSKPKVQSSKSEKGKKSAANATAPSVWLSVSMLALACVLANLA